MASLNLCQFIGNVGKIETRYSADGKAITNISMAVNESWKDKTSGEKMEKTEWIRVSMFGKLAEIAESYAKVGAPIYIAGKMQTRKWQNKEGADQYTTEIVADQMQLLGSRSDGQSGDDYNSKPATTQKPAAKPAPNFNDDPSDPPF